MKGKLFAFCTLVLAVALITGGTCKADKLAYVVESQSPNTIRLLDLSTKQDRQICSLGKITPEYSSLRWCNNQKLVFSAYGKSPAGGEGLQIYSVDTAAKTPTAHWCGKGSFPNALPNGEYLHCYGRHNDAVAVSSKEIRRSESAICRLVLSQDGKNYAMYTNDNQGNTAILFCALDKKQWIAMFTAGGQDEDVSSLDLTPDGKKIIYGVDSGRGYQEAYLYDIAPGDRVGLMVKSGAPLVCDSNTSFFITSFVKINPNDPEDNPKLKPVVLSRYSMATKKSSKIAVLHALKVGGIAYHR